MPLAIKGGRRVADHPTPQGNEETVEARARAVLPEDIWRSIPVYMHKSIEQRLAAALAPPIREHGEGVRELAAEIVDEAARCWTWEAGDEAGHAYRLKACAERREEWEDDDCPHDGSCVECVSDMHEHFETSASKERRRELRNLAAKIRGLPAHVIVRQSLGEYLPCEHSSEIVNELGNTIKFRIFAQAGQTRDTGRSRRGGRLLPGNSACRTLPRWRIGRSWLRPHVRRPSPLPKFSRISRARP
jgi:hypothetical protein